MFSLGISIVCIWEFVYVRIWWFCLMKRLSSSINWLLLLNCSKIWKFHTEKLISSIFCSFHFLSFFSYNLTRFMVFSIFSLFGFFSFYLYFVPYYLLYIYCLFFVSCYCMPFDALFSLVFVPLSLNWFVLQML